MYCCRMVRCWWLACLSAISFASLTCATATCDQLANIDAPHGMFAELYASEWQNMTANDIEGVGMTLYVSEWKSMFPNDKVCWEIQSVQSLFNLTNDIVPTNSSYWILALKMHHTKKAVRVLPTVGTLSPGHFRAMQRRTAAPGTQQPRLALTPKRILPPGT